MPGGAYFLTKFTSHGHHQNGRQQKPTAGRHPHAKSKVHRLSLASALVGSVSSDSAVSSYVNNNAKNPTRRLAVSNNTTPLRLRIQTGTGGGSTLYLAVPPSPAISINNHRRSSCIVNNNTLSPNYPYYYSSAYQNQSPPPFKLQSADCRKSSVQSTRSFAGARPGMTGMPLSPMNSFPMSISSMEPSSIYDLSTEFMSYNNTELDSGSYLPSEFNENRLEPAVRSCDLKRSKGKKGKKGQQPQQKLIDLISDADMEILEAYYYHWLFTIARGIAVLCILIAFILVVLSLSVPTWIEIPLFVEPFGPEYLQKFTMFNNCTYFWHEIDDSLLAKFKAIAAVPASLLLSGDPAKQEKGVTTTMTSFFTTTVQEEIYNETNATTTIQPIPEPPIHRDACTPYSFGGTARSSDSRVLLGILRRRGWHFAYLEKCATDNVMADRDNRWHFRLLLFLLLFACLPKILSEPMAQVKGWNTFFKFRVPALDPAKIVINQHQLNREQHCLKPFRLFGVLFSMSALSMTIAACTIAWLQAPTGLQITLWERCLKENATLVVLGVPCQTPQLDVWQSCIIGVLIFTSVFGSVSFVLAMCGVCVRSLPKRLYYYHSAAEILFVCAMLTGAAVIGFPLSVRYKMEIASFAYGQGFYVAVVGSGCYLIAAFLLNLDLFIMCTVPSKDHQTRPRAKSQGSIPTPA